MAQRIALVAELKRVLKERGIGYARVARHLKLSHASVKRLFSTADFSLARIDAICELASLELTDLVEQLRERTNPVIRLTIAQEREIVSDPRLFLIAWLLLNKWRLEDIVTAYTYSEREAYRYLLRLDKLKIIELQPGNRTRLRINRYVSWNPGGPLQRYVHDKLLREFFTAEFSDDRSDLCFQGAILSDAALAQIKRALRQTLRECVELSERDARVPLPQRRGAAFVLAVRPWQFTGFDALKRPANESGPARG